MTTPHPQQKTIDGLRELADWLEANHDAPRIGEQTINVSVGTREELAKAARIMSRTKKFPADKYFVVRRSFGAIDLDVFTHREQVCNRVQVGEKIIPATPAQPERTEPVYEWECGSPILAEVEEPQAANA